jgi:hypothetical protein
MSFPHNNKGARYFRNGSHRMLMARAHKIAVAVVFGLLTAWLLVGSWQSLRKQPAEPLAVHNRPPENKLNSKEGRLWNWLTRDAAGFFTLWLVIVGTGQVVLFLWQLRLIAKTLGPAKAAAEAANLNAQAVINAERARLYVIIERQTIESEIKLATAPQLPELGDHVRLEDLELEYSFRNYGKTPAFILEVGHGTAVTEGVPKGREYAVLVPLPIDYVVGAGEKTVSIRDVAMPSMTVATARSIRDLDKTFWFHGYVEYDDTFGWRRKFEFVWHYSAVSEGFRLFSYRETAEKREI